MNINVDKNTLRVSGIEELSSANSNNFRDQVRGDLKENVIFLEVDLSNTVFVDSCGLGALIALYKSVRDRKGMLRIVNPTPPVQQILELTRMHRIFEIVQR